MEELLIEKDWGKALIRLDVADRLIYSLFFTHLDDAAIDQGAGSYSLCRAAPLLVVQGPAQVGRRPLQGLGRRPRDGRHEQGAARRRPQPQALDAALARCAPLAARVDELVGAGAAGTLESTATTIRDAVAALTA